MRTTLCEGSRTLGSVSPGIARPWVMLVMCGPMYVLWGVGNYWNWWDASVFEWIIFERCSKPSVEDSEEN